MSIKKIENIDKKFIKKYETLKESHGSDIFLAVEVEIDEQPWEIVILTELKSKREEGVVKLGLCGDQHNFSLTTRTFCNYSARPSQPRTERNSHAKPLSR